jgi:hypothetical protein
MAAKHPDVIGTDALYALSSPPPPANIDPEVWGASLLHRASQRLAVLHVVLVEHLVSGSDTIPAHARQRLAAEAVHLDRVLRKIDALIQEARPEPEP